MKEGILNPGEILNQRYEILSTIGEGAYGMVYLAADLTVPGAQWAIKEVWEGSLSDDERSEALELFKKEAATLRELNHTGVPKVLDFFSEEARHYMVMEYIEGETLEQVLDRGTPDIATIIAWSVKVCDILDYLHNLTPMPLIFRDLKPSNIMLTRRGRLLLIDFGIARFFNPVKSKDTAIMGTPGFSPPEQYGRGQTDMRTDIYGLGATIYYMLTAEDLTQFAFKIPPVSLYNRAVTPELEQVIMRCLEMEPSRRYDSARELRQELQRFLYGGASKSSFSTAPAPSLASVQQVSPAPVPATTGWLIQYPPVVICWAFFILSIFSLGLNLYILSVLAMVLSAFAAVVFSAATLPYYLTNKRYGHGAFNIITLMLFAAALFLPSFLMRNHNHGGSLTACKSNLKNIGTALEMYSTDYQGRYPHTIDMVTPNYLKTLPTCPMAGKVTYNYMYRIIPDIYTAWCEGNYHKNLGIAPCFPQYDAINGLYER
jgi:hypothetical protein